MRFTEVTLRTWKWEGAIVAGGRSTEFAAWAKRYCDAEVTTDEHAAGHAYVEMGHPWLLWVESLKNLPSLAHEALHIASGVLEGRGLTFTHASEEAYCYTVEQILREALARDRRWKVCR